MTIIATPPRSIAEGITRAQEQSAATVPAAWLTEQHPTFCGGFGCGGTHVGNPTELNPDPRTSIVVVELADAHGNRAVGLTLDGPDTITGRPVLVNVELTPAQTAELIAALAAKTQTITGDPATAPRSAAEVTDHLREAA